MEEQFNEQSREVTENIFDHIRPEMVDDAAAYFRILNMLPELSSTVISNLNSLIRDKNRCRFQTKKYMGILMKDISRLKFEDVNYNDVFSGDIVDKFLGMTFEYFKLLEDLSTDKEPQDFINQIVAKGQFLSTLAKDEVFIFLDHRKDNPSVEFIEFTFVGNREIETENGSKLVSDYKKVNVASIDAEPIILTEYNIYRPVLSTDPELIRKIKHGEIKI